MKRDDFAAEFCVIGAADPRQHVETMAPDGTRQRWRKSEEEGLLVFRPPDGYSGGQAVGWVYDPRLQVGKALSRKMEEHLALRERVSVAF